MVPPGWGSDEGLKVGMDMVVVTVAAAAVTVAAAVSWSPLPRSPHQVRRVRIKDLIGTIQEMESQGMVPFAGLYTLAYGLSFGLGGVQAHAE